MIFQHTIDLVLSGAKTQTRRIVKLGEDLRHEDDAPYNEVMQFDPKQTGFHRVKYAIGRTYAIQPGRGKPAVARMRITDIRREDVRCILDLDAKAEGFNNQLHFLETWTKMHDSSRQFYMGDDGFYHYYRGVGYGWQIATGIDIEDMLAHRPAERYQAWALTFEVVK